MNAVLKFPPRIMRGIEKNPGLEQLIAIGTRRTFQANNMIFFAGTEAAGLYYILSGSVSVLGEHDDERHITHDFLNAGEFFGEISFFLPQESRVRSATIRARSTCSAVYITYKQVMEVAKVHPEIITMLGEQMAKRLVLTSRRLKDMTFLDVKGRLHRVLMDLSRQQDAVTHPDGMQIRITRTELGTIVGCSREMAGRAVAKMVEEGLVAARGKTFVVHGAR